MMSDARPKAKNELAEKEAMRGGSEEPTAGDDVQGRAKTPGKNIVKKENKEQKQRKKRQTSEDNKIPDGDKKPRAQDASGKKDTEDGNKCRRRPTHSMCIFCFSATDNVLSRTACIS